MTPLPPFDVQYQKILDAYMADEIQPFDNQFCFCGTLAMHTYDDDLSVDAIAWSTTEYTAIELKAMEFALLNTINRQTYPNSSILQCLVWEEGQSIPKAKDAHPNYDTALFNGMCAALDVLKTIHESRGEAVDAAFLLPKRQLLTH